jgi:hypothetical protein
MFLLIYNLHKTFCYLRLMYIKEGSPLCVLIYVASLIIAAQEKYLLYTLYVIFLLQASNWVFSLKFGPNTPA